MTWEQPERHASVGSTNVEALADPRPGRVVVADHQSAGQGRRGRSWQSPPGAGLAISAVVPAVAPELMGWLPLAAGLAAARALAAGEQPVDAALKWPNDVLAPLVDPSPGQLAVLEARGRRWGKVAGVLAAVAGTGDVVIGTGINVDHAPEQLPVPTATSWRLARGGDPLPQGARGALLDAYLEGLATWHAALAAGDARAVRTAYLEQCLTIGQEVVVHRPDGGTTTGTAAGLDDSGALLVDGPGGRTVHHAGDVEHLRPK
ncbi:biotin--[acetyl-CoA-carboxylase] ligase [Ornithinimicrobium humiphilum]|uniref:biotin--[biotin carboxyl-carrier protein] ligase n=1 Tax=Ornithinimicrobium humiphilum TaxID=125288 RepID=A0A543KM94_9MICO|nr:BirA family biotin operon repressor/biotin-[acetyl-CoA-carboxylase] ligase [Ornithinimicrobium humiphilum]